MKINLALFLSIFSMIAIAGQENIEKDSIHRKKISAVRITEAPKIDGILDDDVWQHAPIAGKFIERSPNNGTPVPDSLRTEVRILYDDTGIYFGAKLYDPQPDKIAREFVERDDVGNDDIFGVIINGYNDKQQSLEFLVMPTGVQYDAKLTNDYGEDSSWNGVWQSAVKINNDGWTVELKIPFSELRFPKSGIKDWGLNMIRRIQRTKTMYDWNMVDNKKGSYMLYDGILQNIDNIHPPLRLSFLPYFSTYLNTYDGKTTSQINGGMDVKYGINDAFTLDTTLIPDFGQANFDRSVLNLSPFEQQFQEQRSFFTEGTELFNKGGLFYSRRVGGAPSRRAHLQENEKVNENPAQVKLINATKISGRTQKGLGIGVFNGVTQKAEAKIVNEVTGEERKEILEPLANYNVLVLDQRFQENSSVTFVNTNVMRAGNFRDANVSGLLLDLTNKKNTYNYYGNVKGSWISGETKKFGTHMSAGLSKIFGKNRFGFNTSVKTKDYDINDLGYTGGTNYLNFNSNYSYRILQPTKHFNNIYLNVNLHHSRRLDPDLFTDLNLNLNTQFTDKRFRSYGFGIESSLFGENDIYEPRTYGRHLRQPGYFDVWLWYNSDSRKKFGYNVMADYYAYNETGRNRVNGNLSLRYRFSDRFSLFLDTSANNSNNETGYVGRDENNIYMGRRRVNSVDTGLSSKYIFNDKMALNLSFRHYYSEVNYTRFYTLHQDGSLLSTNYAPNENGTFNSWNMDLRFSWWFAPGSQLTLLFRNATQNYLDYAKLNFKNNFNKLFAEPMANNISLKITYYINYNDAKRWLK